MIFVGLKNKKGEKVIFNLDDFSNKEGNKVRLKSNYPEIIELNEESSKRFDFLIKETQTYFE